jgi:hypothetical protein
MKGSNRVKEIPSDKEFLKNYTINLNDWQRLETSDTFDTREYIIGYYYTKNYCKDYLYYANIYVCRDYPNFGKDTIVIFEICDGPIDTLMCLDCKDYSLRSNKEMTKKFNVPIGFKESIFNRPDKYRYLTGDVQMLIDY